MLAAGDCTHVQLVALTLTCGIYTVTLASLASLMIVVHWDQKRHSVLTPWQRTDKETSFNELVLHFAPAASDRVWLW